MYHARVVFWVSFNLHANPAIPEVCPTRCPLIVRASHQRFPVTALQRSHEWLDYEACQQQFTSTCDWCFSLHLTVRGSPSSSALGAQLYPARSAKTTFTSEAQPFTGMRTSSRATPRAHCCVCRQTSPGHTPFKKEKRNIFLLTLPPTSSQY